jgi:hypothetical protein
MLQLKYPQILPHVNPSKSLLLCQRTRLAQDTIIVGQNIEWVKEKLWNVLCTPLQWTCFEEQILALITLNQNGQVPQLLLTDYHHICPFRVRDILIPTETIGYIYIIISKCDTNFTYIGKSLNISQRLSIHNSGHSAVDTTCITRCLYALAGLISCVGLEKNVRLALEQNWRVLQELSISCNDTPYSIVRLGELVAQHHNQILLNTGNVQQCV